jgi:hypothetical protein
MQTINQQSWPLHRYSVEQQFNPLPIALLVYLLHKLEAVFVLTGLEVQRH